MDGCIEAEAPCHVLELASSTAQLVLLGPEGQLANGETSPPSEASPV